MGACSVPYTRDRSKKWFPNDIILRARWILAVRRPVRTLGSCPVVCRRHFEASLFSGNQGKRKGLARHAVPTLFLPPKQSTTSAPSPEDTSIEETSINYEPDNQSEDELLEVVESSPHDAKLSSEAVSKEELIACRACLAVSGRLYAISGSGLKDALAALTGIEMPEAESFPRHLCVFCMTRLSKCAAFRDSCHRSTALLRTLLEEGALTMDDIKTIDRQTHKLTNELAQVKVYQFQTQPVLEILPLLIKNEDNEPQKVASYTKEEYLESDDGAEYLYLDDSDDNTNTIDKVEDIQVKLIKEDSDAYSDIDDDVEYIPENYTDVDSDTLEETRVTVEKERKTVKLGNNTDKNREVNKNAKTNVNRNPTEVDTDTSEETIEIRKRVKKLLMKNKSVTTEDKDYPTIESFAFFEKQFNCTAKILSKEEQKQQVEERKRKSTSAFCCDLCGKGFKKKNTLTTHMNTHDPGLPHECDVCHLRYRHRRILKMHEKTHRAIFTCNECGCVNRFRTYAQKHYHMHQGTKYPCPHCPAVYDHQTSYCNHVRMQHPAALDACDQCGETFAGRRGLVMHKARAHGTKYKPNGNLKCTGCDVTFLNAEALQRHEELGAGVPHAALWPCAACGESCGSETALKKHAAEHQTDRHRCDECNKTFLNSKSFELHVQRKHMNKRASVAPFQQRQLSTGPKTPALYVCEICGKTLKNGTQMQYHRNVHLAVKPFQCQLCPKAYASKLGLNQHILVHTGERPFKCDQCPLAFRFKSNLVKHVRHIHLQQPKLVTCVACDKVMCAASLALHVRTVHQNLRYERKRNPKRTRVVAEP
ncbi:uncharacterized protein isoform X2 [Choristoneura fumiferana]|uniref:uncharacterized protein isoform X2 n=1 Tax=Choristoneura fumiferana TaxID=7141 RepID=UPI003D157A90